MGVPHHIAVLGGGITGLSSAFHLSRRFPNTLITLLEKQKRLGGWVRSERVQVQSSENKHEHATTTKTTKTVVIEAGPRTLRPNAKSVLELIHLLNLENAIITTPKSSTAARARFLHIPGTPGLVPVPSSIGQLLFSSPHRPLSSILLSAVLREPFRKANRVGKDHNNNNETDDDESVDAFLERRFGEKFARTLGSALVHGIYAADSRALSVRAAFPMLWEMETRGWGSVVRGFVRGAGKTQEKEDDYELGKVVEVVKGAAVYSFDNGMQTLTEALERYLEAQPNVVIKREEHVRSVEMKEDKSFLISSSSGTLTPTHLVSTLPLPVLHTLLPSTRTLPHLTANPTSSVSVINFIFSKPRSEIHPEGFGYLVPRPPKGYTHDMDAPSILGTVFDSCSLSAQDVDGSSLTKLTVMMGGPYPPPPSTAAAAGVDGSPSSISSILAHLETHLQRKLPPPAFSRVWRNAECIPTLGPGHLKRMREMREVLAAGVEEGGWAGRMEVIGAGVGGVSVGDCVEAGKRAGKMWGGFVKSGPANTWSELLLFFFVFFIV